MEQRLSIVTLGVRDLSRAKAFYDALGWRDEGEPEKLVRYNLQSMAFGLYQWDELAEDADVSAAGEGFRGVTLAYCVATKEEVDRVLAEAEQAGGKIVRPAEDAFWGGHRGYFADPGLKSVPRLARSGAFQWGGA